MVKKYNVALYFDSFLDKDQIFKLEHARDNILERFYLLRKALNDENISCMTPDMYQYKNIDCLVFQDLSRNLHIVIKILKNNPNVRLIYIANEPETISPLHNHKIIKLLPIDLILTWNKKLSYKNIKPFVFGHAKINSHKIPRINFNKKKFISTIFSYKKDNNKNSLWSERIKAVKFFSNSDLGIDLYGFNWEKCNLNFVKKSYRGICNNKINTLKNYKFTIAYENTREQDLITEKIFDCFASGTVPIYLGAGNIKKRIPKDTFIDFDFFNSYENLYLFLNSISKQSYEKYLIAAKEFINSAEYNFFSSEYYAIKLKEYINKTIENKKISPKNSLKFKLIILNIIFHNPIYFLTNSITLRKFFLKLIFS